jgi:hypothetical protein
LGTLDESPPAELQAANSNTSNEIITIIRFIETFSF